jgi:hypothetical protein
MDRLLLSWFSLNCTIVSDIILLNVDKHIHEGLLISPSIWQNQGSRLYQYVYKEKVYRKNKDNWTEDEPKRQTKYRMNVNSQYETLTLI